MVTIWILIVEGCTDVTIGTAETWVGDFIHSNSYVQQQCNNQCTMNQQSYQYGLTEHSIVHLQ